MIPVEISMCSLYTTVYNLEANYNKTIFLNKEISITL